MEHYEEQRKLVKFKDEVIWKISQELKKKYDFYQEEFDKETRHEMNEWARLVDLYSAELKKYEMVCAFCGQHLADTNINTDCPDNGKSRDPMEGGVYLTEEQPNRNAFGTRRHWFGRPSQSLGFQKHLNAIKSPQTLKTYSQPTTSNVVTSTLAAEGFLQKHPEVANLVSKLHSQLQKGTDYADMTANLKQADPTNSGFCSRDDFFNSIFDAVKGIKPSELIQLLKTFSDSYPKQINYEDFLRLVEGHGAIRSSIEYGMARMTVTQSPPRGQIGTHAKEKIVDTLNANEARSQYLDNSLDRRLRELSPETEHTQIRR